MLGRYIWQPDVVSLSVQHLTRCYECIWSQELHQDGLPFSQATGELGKLPRFVDLATKLWRQHDRQGQGHAGPALSEEAFVAAVLPEITSPRQNDRAAELYASLHSLLKGAFVHVRKSRSSAERSRLNLDW